MNNSHELQYLLLLNKILKEGDEKVDRTGVGTLSLFGEKLDFSLENDCLPIITTKKVNYKHVFAELLWFISGSTSVKPLQEQGIKFWDANTSREFLNSQGLYNFEEGQLGAGYGHQWRNFGGSIEGINNVADGVHNNVHKSNGVDQLARVIESLKSNPFSRRHIVSAWNPYQLHQVALPPCHILYQFNCVEKGGIKYLDCVMYQRSADMFLGVPYNITCYSLLTHIIAKLVGIKPRKLTIMFGDCHIYKNHIPQVKEQLSRMMMTYPFPTVRVSEGVGSGDMGAEGSINSFKINDFIVENYKCHPFIKADMAV
jgi:thymidylate synthase